MCLSPEEMSPARLQTTIDYIKLKLDNPNVGSEWRSIYEGRLEMFEKLLKEKAEAGDMV
jgi:hypothetical protein